MPISPPKAISPAMLLIYGPPKCGKTSAAVQLPGHRVLDTELPAGTRFLTCDAVPVASFSEYSAACTQAKRDNIKFLLIDTIDRLDTMCAAEANRRYKMSNVGRNFQGNDILAELEMGAGYRWYWKVWNDALDLAAGAAPHVVLIGHVKDKLIKDNFAQENADGADIDVTGKAKNIICSRCDAIALVKRKNQPRAKPSDPVLSDLWINFKTGEENNMGSRCPYLTGKEFLFARVEDKIAKWDEIFPELKSVTTNQ